HLEIGGLQVPNGPFAYIGHDGIQANGRVRRIDSRRADSGVDRQDCGEDQSTRFHLPITVTLPAVPVSWTRSNSTTARLYARIACSSLFCAVARSRCAWTI